MTLNALPPGYQRIETITPGPVFVVDAAQRQNMGSDEHVAIKRIAPRFVDDAAVHAQLAIEADILEHLAGLHAPRLVERGPHFVAMAWLERDAEPFAPTDATAAFEALARVHAAGVVHGDLHPGNLLLEAQSRRVVFVDYALGALGETAPTAALGEARGHYFTMAPELARGAPATQASDIFSLAATLATLAFGVVLREPLHPAAMLARAGGEPVQLAKLAAEANRAGAGSLFRVLAEALAFDAVDRPTAHDAARRSRAG